MTGYSPNEYIRIIRMKKAAELLLENRYTVAEVSYKVGINDPFYFSKCLSTIRCGTFCLFTWKGRVRDTGNRK